MIVLSALLACSTCEKLEPAPFTPEPCPDLFDPGRVPAYSIVIAPEEWAALQDEYANWRERERDGLEVKPYHPLVTFRYGDEVVTDAVIRLKGNPCCSWDTERMQFVIAFNQVDRDGRFHGLRKIALDAPGYDPSALRERVALSYFRDAGFPASCANHATLTVNGELYGTYTNIEPVDDELLQRNFPDEPIGSLFKFDYITQRWQNQNDDSGIDAVLALYELDDDLEGTVEAFDIDYALRFWGAEAVINQSDGYWAGSINFLLYQHPERGWMPLPWDLDNAIDYWGARRSPFRRQDHHGRAGHLDVILEDEVWSERFRDAVADSHARLQADVLIERTELWDAQIRPHLEAEPALPYTLDEHDDAVDSLRAHLSVRDFYLCQLLH
ncbi:MAG: CotH kinase family protein [Alphaproteobacteria bacterium]|nr:CotH kinase family protein [Alphaproteobacteria bacterium]